MNVQPSRTEAIRRGSRMLRTAFGPAIADWLGDPAIVEVMLNPDGRLWVDRLAEGLAETGQHLSPADGERIVRLVAHHVGAEVHAGSPCVSAELPETGERFEGLLPPVVGGPAFAIRKPAVAVFTLDDYVAACIMTAEQAGHLREAVAERRNILVAGGTSTGKTTLTNALLAEIAHENSRIVLIEDTRELQCRAPNLVALRTKDGVASLSELVRRALRLRPDRIPIGEVRGREALILWLVWYQYRTTERLWIRGSTSEHHLPIPLWIPEGFFLVGLILLALTLLVLFLRLLTMGATTTESEALKL